METNKYLAHLADAKTAIRTEINTLSEGGALDANIKTHIATNGGWECTEADTWISDVNTQVNPVLQAFEDAWDDVDSAWKIQKNHPEVPDGDWRGDAYTR